MAPYIHRHAFAASRDRVTIYHSTVADNVNPYNQSSSPIYGNWEHVIEPLVEFDYAKKSGSACSPNRGNFRETAGSSSLERDQVSQWRATDVQRRRLFSGKNARCKSRSLQSSNFKEVTEIQTPDDETVIFVTKQPLAIFLDRLSNRFISSKVAADKYGDQWFQNPIGTGPYKFVSFQRGGNLVFTRNDDYWRGKAAIKEIVIRKVTEDAARLAALEAGQADFINAVPVHEVPRLQRHPRIRVDSIEALHMYFLMMNVAHKPFDNKLVRQAVNYSVDAPAIVKNIFDGIGHPVNGPIASSIIGSDPTLKRYPYDPKKAKQLLAQAGYTEGCDVQLYYSTGRYPKDREVCQAVAAQMTKGGFRVELISQEWALFWGSEGVNGGKLPFYYNNRGPLVDADTFYDQYFRTGTTKRCNYSNPEFDKLIEEEQKAGDNKKRVALLQQAGKILMEDVPFVPLYHLANIYGAAKNLAWEMKPDEKILGWDMKIS